MARADPSLALARQAFRDARVRTLAFAYVFAGYSYLQPAGYRNTYPTLRDRLAFEQSFGANKGLRMFYGLPHHIETVPGYTAWRVGGTLAIAAAVFGLFAAVRALRAEEDAGRSELVLAGVVRRETAYLAALAAIGAGVVVLWLAEFAGFLLGGLPAGGAAYLALATASVVPVCAGIGAVASQLAPTRRLALQAGGGVIGVLFVLRVIADTLNGADWLHWATPLGWAEELRPFAGARPAVLLLALATAALLLVVAGRIAARRDVGTGVLPARDTAEPRLRLLSSPPAQALRGERGTLLAWIGSVAAFSYILGAISNSISSADVSPALQRRLEKLGAGSIVTPVGYLSFVFIFFVLALSLFMCAQVTAARQEEDAQYVETLLALPVGRRAWLAGRLAVAACAAAAIALAAGFFAWAGVRSGGADVGLGKMLEAGVNLLPAALLFGGIAALAYAAVPRAAGGISYAVVTVAFLWQLVGSLLSAPNWLVDATPFAHVGLVPAQAFRGGAAAVMVGGALACAMVALAIFRRRDLLGA
jgi:ABC-2 type transport system permease protein